MTNIKWGILAPGNIAGKFAKDLQLVSDGEIVAVGSRSLERAEAFCEDYPNAKAYGSYASFAADPDIDVVYIASPHTYHHQHTLLCLEAGKHVLVEKPFAMDKAEAEEMIILAKEKGLFLMEAFWTRFLPVTERILENITAGKLGDLKYIQADFGFNAAFNPDSRLYNMDLGGGALLDVGVYPIFLANLLLGKPDELKAMTTKSPTGSDTATSILMTWKSGATAVLSCAVDTDTPTEALICGSSSLIRIHSRWHESKSFEFRSHFSKPPEQITFDDPGKGYKHEIKEVHQCLKFGMTESKKWSLKNTMDQIEILDEVRDIIELEYPKPLS